MSRGATTPRRAAADRPRHRGLLDCPPVPGERTSLVLDRAASRALDRAATDEYGIPGIVLMENAAIAVARATLGLAERGVALLCCGTGNNGGDGWAAARHLAIDGRLQPVVVPLGPARSGSDAAVNESIARRMAIPIVAPEELGDWRDVAVVVDALFGTGLDRGIEGAAADLVGAIGRGSAPVLAVDVPSGFDADAGGPLGTACIRATRTVTFVAPKPGLLADGAERWCGEVLVAGIGAPTELLARFGRVSGAA